MKTDALTAYDFRFPKQLIGTVPASPRDAARLLCYRRATSETTESTFAHLADFLPENALLVFNETKVVPARLIVRKPTGGVVKLLILGTKNGHVTALADKALSEGMRVTVDARHGFTVNKKNGTEYELTPSFPLRQLDALLEKTGQTPIPPYIKNSPLTERQLRERYQSLFARRKGSVAAPTASLHFTRQLLAKLKRHGVEMRYVTLHVGLGTFAPLTDKELSSGALHREWYDVPAATAKAINKAKRQGRPVIAVGTTALRALESATGSDGVTRTGSDETRLFIREGYRFRCVDGLITNFHTPKSSLLMLVAAFAGRENIMKLYRRAIRKKYRLFSFGDGMLLF